ncbi:hypothetical protein ACNAW0_14985 [Micromonospora sp. SL1-18]|uniref:hypothetical protein n=1 Tax=Micromonospora sp. SL1-18 TaxID=3399128 RepID=UPI003A4D9162
MRTAPAVMTGPWVRLLLLISALVGLTAMHTLGHGTHATGGDPAAHAAAGHAVAPDAAAGLTDDCQGDGCTQRSPGGSWTPSRPSSTP